MTKSFSIFYRVFLDRNSAAGLGTLFASIVCITTLISLLFYVGVACKPGVDTATFCSFCNLKSFEFLPFNSTSEKVDCTHSSAQFILKKLCFKLIFSSHYKQV